MICFMKIVSTLIFGSFNKSTFLNIFNLIKRLKKEINLKNEKRERDKIKHLRSFTCLFLR